MCVCGVWVHGWDCSELYNTFAKEVKLVEFKLGGHYVRKNKNLKSREMVGTNLQCSTKICSASGGAVAVTPLIREKFRPEDKPTKEHASYAIYLLFYSRPIHVLV